MDVREKLVELLAGCPCESDCEGMVGSCPHRKNGNCNEIFKLSYCAVSKLAQHLIANGVTVQRHGYLEKVVEVKDNTVCGNGIKIEYKRCSCCKNPVKFFKDDFCGNCGAKLDLPQPPKGE